MLVSLLLFLVVIFLSLIVVRVGAIALEATGLSSDIAAFQAQSAFSGVGFTTKESESIVVHPYRRRVIRVLMLLGSAGTAVIVATLVMTFTADKKVVKIFDLMFVNNNLFNLGAIILGLVLLFLLSKSRQFDKFIRWILKPRIHKIKARLHLIDYEHIMGLDAGYAVGSVFIGKNNWMVGKSIGQLRMQKEGVFILGVYRKIDHKIAFIGTPTNNFVIQEGDRLVAYARDEKLANISKREKGHSGNIERKKAEQEHKIESTIVKLEEEKIETTARTAVKKKKA